MLSDFHVTFLFVALVGATVAISVSVAPLTIEVASLFKVIPVTGTVTVTAQVATLLPSTVVAVILAVPPSTAVTAPFWSTVATAGLSDAHVTALFSASGGVTVAISVSVAPLTIEVASLFKVIPETKTCSFTVKAY